MFSNNVTATQLWSQTLATRDGDLHGEQRNRLRTALSSMRENVSHLVSQIHRDVSGLTVHDVTHLDALWGVADTIAGDGFELTPAEAFVFGAAVLLHDAGMAIAAFPDGLEDLKNTVEWKDSLAEKLRHRKNIAKYEDLSDDDRRDVIFSVLRILHASQAEKLASMTFKLKNSVGETHLIEDTLLREAYAESVGKIAHSHHWDTNILQEKLESLVGSGPGLPPEWTVNEVKVACLLRCADAAHIDAKRAPTFLYAISPVDGVSADHWTFQNKLNQASRKDDKLVISSGQTFDAGNASAWWLCYETVRMIDREIKSANAILADIGVSQFIVKGVSGVEAPSLLARHVRVSGWMPVDAEVRVSDPVSLAKTLGGKNLYGRGAFSPVRELLQNAVDAVRARRAHEDREENWGKVRLIVERDDTGVVWLHVEDQGVGMSRRVLTGPLIDFGKSLWSSNLIREEFPGLSSKNLTPIGKFGIGFFSVFLLGDHIKVVSKKFDLGDAEANVLEFDKLSRRPLVRSANAGELPRDFSTRVSVVLSESSLASLSWTSPRESREFYPEPTPPFFERIIQLVCAVDVQIEIIDRIHSKTLTHTADWLTKPAEDFLLEVFPSHDRQDRARLVATHSSLVRPIKGDDGTVFGRAALSLGTEARQTLPCLYTVGGFAIVGGENARFHEGPFPKTGWRFPGEKLFGVLLGETDDASRASARDATPKEALAKWSTEQAKLVDKSVYTQTQLIEFAQAVISLRGDPGDLPFAYSEGAFRPYDHVLEHLTHLDRIIVPVSVAVYKSQFQYLEASQLNAGYFTSPVKPSVLVFSISDKKLEFGDEYSRRAMTGPHRVVRVVC